MEHSNHPFFKRKMIFPTSMIMCKMLYLPNGVCLRRHKTIPIYLSNIAFGEPVDVPVEMVWPEGKQPSEGEIQMALPGKRGLAGRHHFDEFLPGERGPNYRSERGEGRPWKGGG